MRAPAFWWQPGTGALLSPLGAIYGAIAARRMKQPGAAAGVPVICIGNFTVGGSGKTPIAIAVAQILIDAKQQPFFLSRGYGGSLSGSLRVDPAMHSADQVGDEPLLLARHAPTIVAHDRVAGARLARSLGASVIVMDDGFQNPSLKKNLSLIAVDGSRGIGNGRIIPAGPLRAPLEIQIERANALVVVGSPNKVADVTTLAGSAKVFHAELTPDQSAIATIKGQKVLAFAGIGHPEKFYATLTEAGLTVAEHQSFGDHHRFTASEAEAIVAQADAAGLALVTTEKDHVRLCGNPALAKLAARAIALPVQLVVSEQDQFRRLVLSTVQG